MFEVFPSRKTSKAPIEQHHLDALHHNVRRANSAAVEPEPDFSYLDKLTRTHSIGQVGLRHLHITPGEIAAHAVRKKSDGTTTRYQAVVGEHDKPVLKVTRTRPNGQKPLLREIEGPMAVGAASAIAEQVRQDAVISGQKHREQIKARRQAFDARRAARLSNAHAAEAPARRLHAVA